jgi:hypothetical protein
VYKRVRSRSYLYNSHLLIEARPRRRSLTTSVVTKPSPGCGSDPSRHMHTSRHSSPSPATEEATQTAMILRAS